MDKIDKAVIELLIKNARMTASKIGEEIHLSTPAVIERIRKLEAFGIIEKYTAILNAEKSGKSLTVLIFISMERPECNETLISFVKKEKNILECMYLAGEFDYMLKIMIENTSKLEILLGRIKSLNGVVKTKTVFVLSNVKKEYTPVPD